MQKKIKIIIDEIIIIIKFYRATPYFTNQNYKLLINYNRILTINMVFQQVNY